MDTLMQITETREYTLAELRQLRKDWLALANEHGLLKDCYNIAKEMGERFEEELRYPHDHSPAYRWQEGNVRIELYESTGRFMPGVGEYEIRERLHVFVDGHKAVEYTFTNNPAFSQAESFFVHGTWTILVQSRGIEARKHVESAVCEAQETERQALAQKLLIGVEL